jgi:hypothetical protein
MAKMTKKFSSALIVARREGIPENQRNQGEFYQLLNANGYFWNSLINKWEFVADEPADEPTAFVRLRVWSDSEIIAEVADDISKAMKQLKFKLKERSDAYRCRPPKQSESRIYLTFSPPEKG